MKGKNQKGKKSTIFKIFLIPLIAIMLIQSMITIGTLIVRRTGETLEAYSGRMMNRLVENRGVILQNDMNQRWTSVREQEASIDETLRQFLNSSGAGLEEVLASPKLREGLLGQLFPSCLDYLQSSSTTGIFLVLTGEGMEEGGDYDGFFIRDSDPNTNPANYTDLLLERGSKLLSREWGIPLDTNWTTHFHLDGHGQNESDGFIYEPWKAGKAYPDADTEDLGYWALPFSLEKGAADSYEMITYSFPLRCGGQVYGVLGIEISGRYLNDYFPIEELNGSQQSGYMLAVKDEGDQYIPLVGKGILYYQVCSVGSAFALKETGYNNLSQVQDARLDRQGIYAAACPLKLYSNNVPYHHTEWVLLGLNTENELFGMSRQLYVWMVIAVLIGLVFGVFGIYFLVRHLTRPVQHLMRCISGGSAGLREFKPSNILEVDSLYDVVQDLTDQQKKAENVLLEEKERYRVALESSKDIFFSYDLQNYMLDIVNHKTMSGKWQCNGFSTGFIDPSYIYEADRETAVKVFGSKEDKLYAEFRLKWPADIDYTWVAFSGNVVYDTDGKRWKLIGSIRDIQEQKEREAKQQKRNTTDGVTGFWVFSAGMERLRKMRKACQDGIMVCLFFEHLRETNEKNGIVFGDMILEEAGILIRRQCQELEERTGKRTVALRLNQDEFALWLEGLSRKEAERFGRKLWERAGANFDGELFGVHMRIGMACGSKANDGEKLIRMAKLALTVRVSDLSRPYCFYEDIPKKSQAQLPVLSAREINTFGYGEEVSLVSIALNLFGKGADFPAQMTLMLRKIGRFYEASGVLVSVLRADFNSNYLEYQWQRDGKLAGENVRRYSEKEKESFFLWLGQREVRYFTKEDSKGQIIQCFLNISGGQQGVVLPMYDSGSYMGNITILGIGPQLLENPEEYQNLAELGRVIQSQLNQQQHDIASKAKSEFLSRMSHEIRTPMNGIIGMTAIALQQDQSQERIMDCLQKIRSSSDYLLGLINDVLDMSKIESGKMKLEEANFNIQEMLDTIGELIAPQVAAKRIEFERRIKLEHCWFVADRMRISQVLINLLGNAAKFTPVKGRITLTVEEQAAVGEKISIYFSVRDTGIGIAKEDQERVFRSFEQASGPNPSKQQGTGLGLSISSRLIQMMGSNIQLESKPGEGSAFSFSLLLALGESAECTKQEEEISFAGCRVLVVEDNELNAEIAQSLLEDRDFQVDCVYDGAQAVERIQNTQPGTYDVILMDIMMPVMDGLEATRAIRGMEREDCHTIPIVAMSANAFDDDLKKSVECGMNGHLSKPVEVDKLYQMLNKVIKGKEP